ncbi:MAG: SGNH/GDSL hydrolase family protein [Peptococcaceae bacterium]|nr:SGNH/GDSL hydrolase family protein [Peptococcaceae bacterium]
MNNPRKIEVFGDSLLKGVQINPQNMRYHIDNNIDVVGIEKTHSLSIKNFSKFGCTITKGFALIEKRLQTNEVFCDAIVMDYGGNDCDFNWKEIAECPDDAHFPNTPLDVFSETYHKIIKLLMEKGIRPIMTTLPPLDAHRFFDWFCNGLNKANVLKWLESVETIYRWQENYSRTVEKIAAETNTLLVDLRGAFLANGRIKRLLCEDGTHPNTEGQKMITQAFLDFIEQSRAQGVI